MKQRKQAPAKTYYARGLAETVGQLTYDFAPSNRAERRAIAKRAKKQKPSKIFAAGEVVPLKIEGTAPVEWIDDGRTIPRPL